MNLNELRRRDSPIPFSSFMMVFIRAPLAYLVNIYLSSSFLNTVFSSFTAWYNLEKYSVLHAISVAHPAGYVLKPSKEFFFSISLNPSLSRHRYHLFWSFLNSLGVSFTHFSGPLPRFLRLPLQPV